MLSPLLFNLYTENIFRKTSQETCGGIKITGIHINNLHYADDPCFSKQFHKVTVRMMDKVMYHIKKFGLSINSKKIKTVVFAK